MLPGEYYWLTVIGFVSAFANAFGIGSNGGTNAFVSSVSSLSLTLKQACYIAIFTEFGGALLLGEHTAHSVRSIVNKKAFEGRPEILLVAMVCSLIGSSLWVIYASHRGWPVSSSQSIISAVIGSVTTAFGMDAVVWTSWEKGVAKIVSSWIMSPLVAGVTGACIFTITKRCVLANSNPYERSKRSVPIYIFIMTALKSYIIIRKAPSVKQYHLSNCMAFVVVLSISFILALWSHFFLVPFISRIIENGENMRWWHIFIAPFVSRQPQRDDASTSVFSTSLCRRTVRQPVMIQENQRCDGDSLTDSLHKKSKLFRAIHKIKRAAFHGANVDVLSYKPDGLQHLHNFAARYDTRTEQLYSYLQIFSTMSASFAHGSNDVANAIGPLSIIWHIQSTGVWGNSNQVFRVPTGLLAYGGAGMVIGFVTYGYMVMRSLGNHFTYHSPSRGFSMELATSLIVLTASELGLPVSTTHCMVGATAGVGLCNGSVHAVNWRIIARALFSWMLTGPVTGAISALLVSVCIFSPKL